MYLFQCSNSVHGLKLYIILLHQLSEVPRELQSSQSHNFNAHFPHYFAM